MTSRAVLLVLALGACGAAHRDAVPGPGVRAVSLSGRPAPTRRVRIVDEGQIYASVNQRACLAWPSPDLQARGGESAWQTDNYTPHAGDVGVVLAESTFCEDASITILILDVSGHIVPIATGGVADEPTTPGATTGAVAPLALGVGDHVEIIDRDRVYAGANQARCERWPSPALRARAGASAWQADGFAPIEGDAGDVIAVVNCSSADASDVALLLVQVGDHVVPIARDGVARD